MSTYVRHPISRATADPGGVRSEEELTRYSPVHAVFEGEEIEIEQVRREDGFGLTPLFGVRGENGEGEHETA